MYRCQNRKEQLKKEQESKKKYLLQKQRTMGEIERLTSGLLIAISGLGVLGLGVVLILALDDLDGTERLICACILVSACILVGILIFRYFKINYKKSNCQEDINKTIIHIEEIKKQINKNNEELKTSNDELLNWNQQLEEKQKVLEQLGH